MADPITPPGGEGGEPHDAPWASAAPLLGRRGGDPEAGGPASTPPRGGAPAAPKDERSPLIGREKGTSITPGRFGGEEPGAACADGRPVPLGRLVLSQAFMYAYGLWISSYAIVTLPAESQRMFRDDHDIALAGFLAIAGLTQLAGPVAGYFSDRTRTTIGRRRPYLVLGGLLVLPALLVQWASRGFPDSDAARLLYVLSFALSMLSLNVMYTAASGVIPDMCPDEQVGQANGVMAAMQACGASSGFLYTYAFPDVANLYRVYVLLVLVCVPSTVLALRDGTTIVLEGNQDTAPNAVRAMRVEGGWPGLRALARCYTIDRRRHPDFFWLFVTRALYYAGCSAQVYLQYLFRDLIVRDDGSHLSGNEPAKYVADLAFIGQVSGMLAAYPSALLSDRTGRKPVVAFACAGLVCIYVGFMVVHRLRLVLLMGAAFGALNGVYLSVDYALAVDTLPNRSEPAESLAVWGVASFLGTSIGPAVLGPILYANQEVDRDTGRVRNTPEGYVYALSVSAFFMVLAALALKLIRGAR